MHSMKYILRRNIGYKGIQKIRTKNTLYYANNYLCFIQNYRVELFAVVRAQSREGERTSVGERDFLLESIIQVE